MFGDMNSGYNGYSMSNRAVEAYNDDKKPYSKWTKSEIMDSLENRFSEEELKKIKKYNAHVIKSVFLTYSEWHHTSRYCNETFFYEINIREDESFNKIEEHLKRNEENYFEEQKEKEEKKKERKLVKFKYVYWTGTRKHPKYNEAVDYGILVDQWIYYVDGGLHKKGITTKGVEILAEYKRSPKGLASKFNRIKKLIK